MFQVELKQDDTPSRRTIFHRLGKHKRRWRPCPRRLALLFPALPPPRINNETRESSRVAAVARTKEEKDQQIAIYGCAQKTKWDTAKGHYFRLIGSARRWNGAGGHWPSNPPADTTPDGGISGPGHGNTIKWIAGIIRSTVRFAVARSLFLCLVDWPLVLAALDRSFI